MERSGALGGGAVATALEPGGGGREAMATWKRLETPGAWSKWSPRPLGKELKSVLRPYKLMKPPTGFAAS